MSAAAMIIHSLHTVGGPKKWKKSECKSCKIIFFFLKNGMTDNAKKCTIDILKNSLTDPEHYKMLRLSPGLF